LSQKVTSEKPHPTLKGIATGMVGRLSEIVANSSEKPHPTLKGIATSSFPPLRSPSSFPVKNPIPP